MKRETDGICYILVYVDDIILCTNLPKLGDEILTGFSKEFEFNDLGPVTHYLGIHVEKDSDGIYWINQKIKIEQLIRHLGMEEAKECSVPMTPDYLKDNNESKQLPNNTKYREVIGCLLYLSTISRPDISTAVGILSRRVNEPSEKDWNAVKNVIRYLKHTKDLKLKLMATDYSVTIFVDADWAGDSEDRKSTSGFVINFGNSPIIWGSKKQKSTALSSTEAEFIAASEACKEGLWLLQLLKSMMIQVEEPMTVLEDNQGCIALIKNERSGKRSKHIDVRYNFVRDLCQDKIISLMYCTTQDMLADVFTKPLPKPRFEFLREKLNLN